MLSLAGFEASTQALSFALPLLHSGTGQSLLAPLRELSTALSAQLGAPFSLLFIFAVLSLTAWLALVQLLLRDGSFAAQHSLELPAQKSIANLIFALIAALLALFNPIDHPSILLSALVAIFFFLSPAVLPTLKRIMLAIITMLLAPLALATAQIFLHMQTSSTLIITVQLFLLLFTYAWICRALLGAHITETQERIAREKQDALLRARPLYPAFVGHVEQAPDDALSKAPKTEEVKQEPAVAQPKRFDTSQVQGATSNIPAELLLEAMEQSKQRLNINSSAQPLSVEDEMELIRNSVAQYMKQT